MASLRRSVYTYSYTADTTRMKEINQSHVLLFHPSMRATLDQVPNTHLLHNAVKLESSSSLVNEDLFPSPPEKRTWTAFNFFAYWWSESWAISAWSIGASLITVGATVRDAVLVVLFANLLTSVVIVLNGRAAAAYHIGFPVLSRTSFGIYGQYFVVVLRALVGIAWGGVQLYYQGQLISVCLRCVFPGWNKIPNTIPANQAVTVQGLVGFFLALLSTLPFMFIHTTKIRHVFSFKAIVVPLAGLGIVCWAITANKGISAHNLIDESKQKSTSIFAWSLVAQLNAVFGANSALIVTVPDLARYSTNRNAQVYGQALGLPLSQTICAAFGIITTAAVKNMYGEAYWNPYDLLNGILDHGYTPKARAGVFFAAAAWAFATLGTSIACNAVPFAADITCLAPKYINIVRGQVVWLVISLSIVPWRYVGTASGFLRFFTGYCIFQGPVVGIMLIDYFFVRRGNLYLPDLYRHSSTARYYFTKGFNIRAFAAFIIGSLLPLPGLIGSFGHSFSSAADHMFSLGWILSFLVGSLAYWALCALFKVPGDDDSYGFEEKVAEAEEMICQGGGELSPSGEVKGDTSLQVEHIEHNSI
ncbi:uracil permease [Trichophyton equinum CBS 127.97]|uniref:Uracil permease n=1 Tax=Trichophyton equinum (strain ATCC MYA-4606 / CBS 127.97) TaxID=559882 RepID=F2PGH0_TRIEC|nr:uracil permease [Trichophyton equinum CBS 127.97]